MFLPNFKVIRASGDQSPRRGMESERTWFTKRPKRAAKSARASVCPKGAFQVLPNREPFGVFKKKKGKKRKTPTKRKKPSRRRYQSICPPEELPTDTVKHPQSMSRPLAILKTRVLKKTIKRRLQIRIAPGSQTPRINARPIRSSIQGRKRETRLTRASGRI